MDNLFGLFVLVVISVVSWFFVLNKSARQDFLKPGWYFLRMNKQQRENDDAIATAAALISAIGFSILLIVVLLVSISRLFK